jgi:hypothetical protein
MDYCANGELYEHIRKAHTLSSSRSIFHENHRPCTTQL